MSKSLLFSLLLTFFSFFPQGSNASEVRLGWTPYVGWMAWPYAEEAGIIETWSKRYAVDTQLKACDDYMSCIRLFNTGVLNAIVVTNVDALGQIAGLGIEASIILVGSGSNGSDGIVMKEGKSVRDLKGKVVHLPMGTVSHFMLVCALNEYGMSEDDLVLVNNPSSVVPAMDAWDVNAVVAWQPELGEILAAKKGNLIFDSSQLPGEIVDVLVVRTEDLRKSPNIGKALAGIWYEALEQIQKGDEEAMKIMATKSSISLKGFKDQMKTTAMYYTPAEALKEAKSRGFKQVMTKVMQFWKMQGQKRQSGLRQSVGIAFPDGARLGNKRNIKLHIDTRYMKAAKDKRL